MSFRFTDSSTGRIFKVEGQGLTEAQARQIFQQQQRAGSLVGLQPGMVLDAAQQAAGGLPGAAAQAAQAASQSVGSVTGTAATALRNITDNAFGGAPTNGIGIADFAQQAPALDNIAQLGENQVRSAMAQASRLVGQNASTVSNTLGLGKFGFNGEQLERAGMIKPGTTSAYLAQGQNTLTDVLKSPSVWTGKDGIRSMDDLLASVPSQDRIQQQLMQTGTSALSELGLPISNLSPQALAGTAMNAARSIADTFSWATGGTLPTGVADTFNQVARDGAFAVGFGDTKVSDAMKQQTLPEESIDTVVRATVDAAAGRVIGNEKVPDIEYNTPLPPISGGSLSEQVAQASVRLGAITQQQTPIFRMESQIASDPNVGVDIIREYERLLSDLTDLLGTLQNIKSQAANAEPPLSSVVAAADRVKNLVDQQITQLESAVRRVRQRMAAARGR